LGIGEVPLVKCLSGEARITSGMMPFDRLKTNREVLKISNWRDAA